MPVHLQDHIAGGGHIPGIFVLSPELSMGETIDELILIGEGSLPDEYQDQIRYLPLDDDNHLIFIAIDAIISISYFCQILYRCHLIAS
jgi:hypothetical protein